MLNSSIIFLIILIGLLTSCLEPGIEEPINDLTTPSVPKVSQESEPLDVGWKVPHRLNSREYNSQLSSIFGTDPDRVVFQDSSDDGFDNISDSLLISDRQVAQYLKSAISLGDFLTKNPENLTKLYKCEISQSPCLNDFLRNIYLKLNRKHPSEDAINKLTELFNLLKQSGNDDQMALIGVIQALILSPSFNYRLEEKGEGQLSPMEYANRLSFFLWGTSPDDHLYRLASTHNNLTTDLIHSEVDRMLQDPRSRSFIKNFSRQWLGTQKLLGHQVNHDLFPEFDLAYRQGIIESMDRLMAHFLSNEMQPYEFLAGHTGSYAGLLRNPGFLTASSFSHRTSPTMRANWIMEKVLCSKPPPPPPGVETEFKMEEEHSSIEVDIRKRLEKHRDDPQCASCHALMDPLGMVLENYDPIGRIRDSYLGGGPINQVTTTFDGVELKTVEDLGRYLSDDPRFKKCIVKKVYTYAMGRRLQEIDLKHIAYLNDRWTDFSLKSLIKVIVTSRAFRAKSAAP